MTDCPEFCACVKCITTRVLRREADRRQADIAVAEERRVGQRRANRITVDDLYAICERDKFVEVAS